MTQAAARRGELPHSIAHERAVLAMIMLDGGKEAWAKSVPDLLRPEDFFQPEHQHIYRALLWLRIADLPCVAEMIAYALSELGTIDDVDNLIGAPWLEPYLVQMTGEHYSSIGIISWARVVKGHANRRRAITEGARQVAEAYKGSATDWRSDPRYQDER